MSLALLLLLTAAPEGHADKTDEADRLIVKKLDEIRQSRGTGADARRAPAAYAEAFRGHGIDVLDLEPAEAAKRIRASAASAELVAALDDWATTADDKQRERLNDILGRTDPDALRGKIRAALAKGDRRALAALLPEVKASELSPALLVRLGTGLDQLGARAEAAGMLRKAQRAHPSDFWINFALASALARDGATLDDAIRYYTAALALRPSSSEVHLNLGVVLMQRGKLDEAVEATRDAIRLQPDLAPAHRNLGHILRAMGRADEAVAAYREALRLDPTEAAAHRGLGELLADVGKYAEAEAALRQAIRLRPDFPEAHLSLGVLQTRTGKLDAAIGSFKEAIRLRPDSAPAHLNLGQALLTMGKVRESEVEFRMVLRLTPNDPMAHVSLGKALKEQGKLKEALEALKRGRELLPEKDPRRGRVEEALRAVERELEK
jgi:serine/threonine-protein kinase